MEDQTQEAAATAQAEALFTQKAAESWFSAPHCNRFELKFLTDGQAILTFGSIGIVQLDDAIRPIAHPITTVSVNPALLRNLANLIDKFIPGTSEDLNDA